MRVVVPAEFVAAGRVRVEVHRDQAVLGRVPGDRVDLVRRGAVERQPAAAAPLVIAPAERRHPLREGHAGALRDSIDAENNRPAMKKAGYLTRDPRAVERKKYGRAKARRSFQFSKR